MNDPLLNRGEKLRKFVKNHLQKAAALIKNNKFLFVVLGVLATSLIGKFWNFQSAPYAQAYLNEEIVMAQLQSPLFEKKAIFPTYVQKNKEEAFAENGVVLKITEGENSQLGEFEKNLASIVEGTPIAEMVPFIARRDSRVAAFLIGIAKKESSFGLASPSKNGEDCHNYWGYKGIGSKGEVSGYSCFGSPQEAVEIVGNRIEILVNNNHSTPAKMVDTWKCGRSCAGDPGAPGWVATVALYFNEIVKHEG